MTVLSVNVNKLALLRNSRGRDYPDLLDFAGRFIALGAGGITVHPRPDERHIRRDDARALGAFLQDYPDIEFNIEGYPAADFLRLVEEVRPAQCTLVPDTAAQLTSDHGWNCVAQQDFLVGCVRRLRQSGVRVALFLDPDPAQVKAAAATGADRIELYTEAYARAFGTAEQDSVLARYRETALAAQHAGLGVNAGHDLDLDNLGAFLTIPGILEVSIGHALTIECIELGMNTVLERYLALCSSGY